MSHVLRIRTPYCSSAAGIGLDGRVGLLACMSQSYDDSQASQPATPRVSKQTTIEHHFQPQQMMEPGWGVSSIDLDGQEVNDHNYAHGKPVKFVRCLEYGTIEFL
jgi:hypothetical protein